MLQTCHPILISIGEWIYSNRNIGGSFRKIHEVVSYSEGIHLYTIAVHQIIRGGSRNPAIIVSIQADLICDYEQTSSASKKISICGFQ
jgi:hypothetical protein